MRLTSSNTVSSWPLVCQMSNEFVFLEVFLINLSNNETNQLQIPLGNNQVRMTHFMFLTVKLQNKQCSSLKRPPAVLTLCQSAVLTHQWMSCECASVSNQLFFPKMFLKMSASWPCNSTFSVTLSYNISKEYCWISSIMNSDGFFESCQWQYHWTDIVPSKEIVWHVGKSAYVLARVG